MTALLPNQSPLATSPDQYVLMARQSYAILCYAANALQAARTHYEPYSAFDHLADLVHAFIDRLVWADHRLDLNESVVIEAILSEDELRNGSLRERLYKVPANPFVLVEVPQFIRECRRYDAANGTALASSAVNALDTLGMGILAADREITNEEYAALGEALASSRRYVETHPWLA